MLIVDDNEKLGKNLSDILEFKGCKTSVVCDGYRAIEAVKNGEFDVVLMDIKMPGMSGVDTLKILRRVAPHMAVILITAFADDVVYKDDLKNIDLKIIEKPIDVDRLLAMLEDIC